MWEIKKLKIAKLGLFLDASFEGDLRGSQSTSGGAPCLLGSHTCVPISWMCKKQTAVSESETISIVAGLRMDGSPALQFWECVWKSCPVDQPRETFSRQKTRQSYSVSLTL